MVIDLLGLHTLSKGHVPVGLNFSVSTQFSAASVIPTVQCMWNFKNKQGNYHSTLALHWFACRNVLALSITANMPISSLLVFILPPTQHANDNMLHFHQNCR